MRSLISVPLHLYSSQSLRRWRISRSLPPTPFRFSSHEKRHGHEVDRMDCTTYRKFVWVKVKESSRSLHRVVVTCRVVQHKVADAFFKTRFHYCHLKTHTVPVY